MGMGLAEKELARATRERRTESACAFVVIVATVG